MERNYKKLAKEITKTGFFSEYLPPCFVFPDKALNKIPSEMCDLIPPYSFTMSKYSKDGARRTICIPEVGSYLVGYSYMMSNDIFEELIEFTDKNEHSFSPVISKDNTIIRHEQVYDGDDTVEESSLYIKNIRKKLILSAGARKILKLDISNCYSSLYMHMIPAIMLGVTGAEEEYNKSIHNVGNIDVSSVYTKYKNLDKIIRRQNLNRTNGLLIGTLFSRMIIEAILTRIDLDLESKSLKFVRYVDDYEFFYMMMTKTV